MGVMTSVAIAATVASAALSAKQGIDGYKKMKRAKNDLDNYQRQDLDNAFNDIQISTIGSDLIREENARNMSTATDTIAQAGDRSIVGGLPKIVAQTNIANQDARKYLDDQVNKRSYAMGQDEQQLRSMREARDNANITALSTQYNAGKQDMWNGMRGVVASIPQGATSILKSKSIDGELTNLNNNNVNNGDVSLDGLNAAMNLGGGLGGAYSQIPNISGMLNDYYNPQPRGSMFGNGYDYRYYDNKYDLVPYERF